MLLRKNDLLVVVKIIDIRALKKRVLHLGRSWIQFLNNVFKLLLKLFTLNLLQELCHYGIFLSCFLLLINKVT